MDSSIANVASELLTYSRNVTRGASRLRILRKEADKSSLCPHLIPGDLPVALVRPNCENVAALKLSNTPTASPPIISIRSLGYALSPPEQ